MYDCASLVQLALMRHTHLGWQTRAEGKGSSRNAAGLADADQSLPLLCMQRIHDQYVARISDAAYTSRFVDTYRTHIQYVARKSDAAYTSWMVEID